MHVMSDTSMSRRSTHMFCALMQVVKLARTTEEQRAITLALKAYGHLRRFAKVHLNHNYCTSEEQYTRLLDDSMEELYNFACLAEQVRDVHTLPPSLITSPVALSKCRLLHFQSVAEQVRDVNRRAVLYWMQVSFCTCCCRNFQCSL